MHWSTTNLGNVGLSFNSGHLYSHKLSQFICISAYCLFINVVCHQEFLNRFQGVNSEFRVAVRAELPTTSPLIDKSQFSLYCRQTFYGLLSPSECCISTHWLPPCRPSRYLLVRIKTETTHFFQAVN